MLIKCASLSHLCVSLQRLPVHVQPCPTQRDARAAKVKGQATDRVGGLLSSKGASLSSGVHPSSRSVCLS